MTIQILVLMSVLLLIKESMEKDKLRGEEFLETLQDQISYLRKEIEHKNEIIKTLICSRNCYATIKFIFITFPVK